MEPFDAVVAEHGAAVLRLCRSRLRRADADDAWSETFIAAMRAYPTLPPGSNVRGWLCTIAHHKAIDIIRRQQRSPDPVDHRAHDVGADDVPHDPIDVALLAALGQLGDKQRNAVLYHHVVGLPYAEVATVLDTSEAAARRSASDGLATLRSIAGALAPRGTRT